MSGDEARFWDRISKNYDRSDNADETYLKMLEVIKGYLHGDDMVMDFGCATGSVSIDLSHGVGQVVGIDISSEMIRLAREKAKRHRAENVSFSRSTIFDERHKERAYNAIIAFNILHLLDDPALAVRRISELLKEDGIFISNTACLGDKGRFVGYIMTLISRIGFLPSVKKFRVSELRNMIENNGFKIIEQMSFGDPHHPFIIARKSG